MQGSQQEKAMTNILNNSHFSLMGLTFQYIKIKTIIYSSYRNGNHYCLAIHEQSLFFISLIN